MGRLGGVAPSVGYGELKCATHGGYCEDERKLLSDYCISDWTTMGLDQVCAR